MIDVMLQVGVKVLLKNKEGKFLILKRNTKKYSDVERVWDCVGGRIDPGTPLLDNLRREINEETKLRMEGEPKLVAAQDILKSSDRHVVRLTYVGEADGTPILDHEHDDYKWVTQDELRDMREEKLLDEFLSNVLENCLL